MTHLILFSHFVGNESEAGGGKSQSESLVRAGPGLSISSTVLFPWGMLGDRCPPNASLCLPL